MTCDYVYKFLHGLSPQVQQCIDELNSTFVDEKPSITIVHTEFNRSCRSSTDEFRERPPQSIVVPEDIGREIEAFLGISSTSV